MDETWSAIVSPQADGAAAGGRRSHLAREIGQALDEIAEALATTAGDAAQAADANRMELADGPIGAALFFQYLDRYRPGQGHAETARLHAAEAVRAAGRSRSRPGLFTGVTGVAWAVEHLCNQRLLAAGPDGHPGDEVAAALAAHLQRRPWRDDYDLVSGLVGYGVWALERMPREGGAPSLRGTLAQLSELAVHQDEGLAWLTPATLLPHSVRARFPAGRYNLGVAHGVPGVVGLLGSSVAAGFGGADAQRLLDRSVEWLLGRQLASGSAACFPYFVAPGTKPSPARLAWCYGDLGIALVLLGAARAARRPRWEREALRIARCAAARPHAATGVVDGGLCHGAAGLAHMYNRLFHATGDASWRRQAISWFGRLLAMRERGAGVAGWQAWRAPHDQEGHPTGAAWAPDRGFLSGTAGIGLALLAAVSAVEPQWDRVLLCSGPARCAGPAA